MWTEKRLEAARKVKALRGAGFTNRDIVEAKRGDLVEYLLRGDK